MWVGRAARPLFCSVLASVLVTPRVGGGTLAALVLAGRMSVSVLLDHFGFVGLDRYSLNPEVGRGVLALPRRCRVAAALLEVNAVTERQ